MLLHTKNRAFRSPSRRLSGVSNSCVDIDIRTQITCTARLVSPAHAFGQTFLASLRAFIAGGRIPARRKIDVR